ncbi:unnamed protein product, partial [Phaeothamnion confervicola]
NSGATASSGGSKNSGTAGNSGTSGRQNRPPVPTPPPCNLKPSDLAVVQLLGTGSFGRVTLVQFREANMQASHGLQDKKYFALKALSKVKLIERKQLTHVRDERRLMNLLVHPFVLRLHASFQDADCLYLLTEAAMGGELWSVIYEGLSGHEEGRLPHEHGKFYGACVLDALAHIHGRGMAYRDLKPENVVLDEQGYPKLIDLGFCKEIPFTSDGVLHPKSFTMCGTPEYLAPEFIFNSGHDAAADYW